MNMETKIREIAGSVLTLTILYVTMYVLYKYLYVNHFGLYILIITGLTFIAYYNVKLLIRGEKIYNIISLIISGVIIIGSGILIYIDPDIIENYLIHFYSVFVFIVILVDESYSKYKATGSKLVSIGCAVFLTTIVFILLCGIDNIKIKIYNAMLSDLIFYSEIGLLIIIPGVIYTYICRKLKTKALFTNTVLILNFFSIFIYSLYPVGSIISNDFSIGVLLYINIFPLTGLAIAILCNAIYYLIKARKREKIEKKEENAEVVKE